MLDTYEVHVSNIGLVYAGDSEDDAREAYAVYVTQSKSFTGRAAGETVVLFAEGEVWAEFTGDLASE